MTYASEQLETSRTPARTLVLLPHEVISAMTDVEGVFDQSSNPYELDSRAWALVRQTAAVALNEPTRASALKVALKDPFTHENDQAITKVFKTARAQILESPVRPFWRECGSTYGKRYWIVDDETKNPDFRVRIEGGEFIVNQSPFKESVAGALEQDDDNDDTVFVSGRQNELSLEADNKLGVYSVYVHKKLGGLGLWGVGTLDYLVNNPNTFVTAEQIAQNLPGGDQSVAGVVTTALQIMRQDRYISPFLMQKNTPVGHLLQPQTQSSMSVAFGRRLYADLTVNEKRILTELVHGPASAGPVELAKVFDAVKHTLQHARRPRVAVFNQAVGKLGIKYAPHITITVPAEAGNNQATIELTTIQKKLAQQKNAILDK